MKPHDEKGRVVIYARVSSDEQAKGDNTSVDSQIAQCHAYCTANKWEVVEIARDDGISGGSMDRPGWNRVVELIQTGNANMVLATSLDRMSRTVEGFLKFVSGTLEPNKADFACINEKIDTSGYLGYTMMVLMLAFAEMYRKQVSEKTRGAMKSRAHSGLCLYHPPFGTKPGPTKGVPIKDEKTWPTLNMIFKMTAEGKSRAEVLRYLKERGIKSVRGGEWGHSTLRDVLTSHFYIGEISYKDEYFPAQHDCLVDRQLWDIAQSRVSQRRGRKPVDYPYILRGKILTSHFRVAEPHRKAGEFVPFSSYYAKGRSDIYHYYKRSDVRRAFGGTKVEPADSDAERLPTQIRADELDKIVVQALIRLASKDESGALKQKVSNVLTTTTSSIKEDRELLLKHISGIRRKREQTIRKLDEMGVSALMKIAHVFEQTLADCDLDEEKAIAELTGLDAAICRIELAEAETDEIISQINLIDQLWQNKMWNDLHRSVDALVEYIDLRVVGEKLVARIRLRAMPLIREIMTVRPNERNAPAGGLEPPTNRLTAGCSAIELRGNGLKYYRQAQSVSTGSWVVQRRDGRCYLRRR